MRPEVDSRTAEPKRGSFALEGLSSALARGGAHDLAVVVPAPIAPAEALLAFDGAEPAVVWKDGTTEWACLGAARGVALRGPVTAAVRAQIVLLTDNLAVIDLSGSFVHQIRVFGGMAFDPTRAIAPPWDEHGAGRFVLPRWSYVRDGGRAWVVVVATSELRRDPGAREALVSDTARLLDLLVDPPQFARLGPVHDVSDEADARWLRRVGLAQASVCAGRARKIVTSRVRRMRAELGVSIPATLAELSAHQIGCVVYAFRFGGATLVGATPETLVERRGLHVHSDALAGSAPVGREIDLSSSPKDRQEHAFVVRDVAARLASSCDRVTCPARPAVRTLRDVAHLHTPIDGVLRKETHVLDLVTQLHPTPAVAGAPREEALRWIAAEEGGARGWYAGPIGWCDATGDGRFVVALRAAVVRGRDVWTFAGAGIVEGSAPERELDEVRLKERAVLRALGDVP